MPKTDIRGPWRFRNLTKTVSTGPADIGNHLILAEGHPSPQHVPVFGMNVRMHPSASGAPSLGNNPLDSAVALCDTGGDGTGSDRHEAPWERYPYGLISWLEMLEFSASMFFWCGHILADIEADCLVGSLRVAGDQPVFSLASRLDEKARMKALKSLGRVEQEFRKVGMDITAETLAEVREVLEGEKWQKQTFQWLIDQLKGIHRLAQKELRGKAFFYVPAERIKFHPTVNNPHIFGEGVATAFPSAAFDISESGICLSLARGTASVAHLMRALEI